MRAKARVAAVVAIVRPGVIAKAVAAANAVNPAGTVVGIAVAIVLRAATAKVAVVASGGTVVRPRAIGIDLLSMT